MFVWDARAVFPFNLSLGVVFCPACFVGGRPWEGVGLADWRFGLVLGLFCRVGVCFGRFQGGVLGPFLRGIVAFWGAILGGADFELAFWRAWNPEPLLCDRMGEAV